MACEAGVDDALAARASWMGTRRRSCGLGGAWEFRVRWAFLVRLITAGVGSHASWLCYASLEAANVAFQCYTSSTLVSMAMLD
jgi:hypothetical protein